MEISYTKEETSKLIQEYYKRLEDRTVSVSISAKKDCVGLYETEGCVTTITVTEKMVIGGMQKDVKETIDEDQLRTILKALFELYGFKLENVTLNDGINSRWEGYGMGEQEIKTAYFKGITLNVKKIKNQSLSKVPK